MYTYYKRNLSYFIHCISKFVNCISSRSRCKREYETFRFFVISKS